MSSFDFDEGYDYTDPKHPGFADTVLAQADHIRKAARENAGSELRQAKDSREADES